MSYTHVIVKMNPIGKAASVTHIETDLDKEFLLERIITPYVNNSSVFVNGARIESHKVESIRVFESSKKYDLLYQDAESKADAQMRTMANEGVIMMPTIATKEEVIDSNETEEITRVLFNRALGF